MEITNLRIRTLWETPTDPVDLLRSGLAAQGLSQFQEKLSG